MDFETYINNLSNESEKQFAKDFYEKLDSLNKLYNSSLNESTMYANGRYNSKICFIFRDKEEFNKNMPFIKKVLSVYEINMWDIIVLYFNKTNSDDKNFEILTKEITIINPFVIYIFDIEQLSKQLMVVMNNLLGRKVIDINNLEELLNKNISTEIFEKFKYLITYNYY